MTYALPDSDLSVNWNRLTWEGHLYRRYREASAKGDAQTADSYLLRLRRYAAETRRRLTPYYNSNPTAYRQ